MFLLPVALSPNQGMAYLLLPEQAVFNFSNLIWQKALGPPAVTLAAQVHVTLLEAFH